MSKEDILKANGTYNRSHGKVTAEKFLTGGAHTAISPNWLLHMDFQGLLFIKSRRLMKKMGYRLWFQVKAAQGRHIS